MSDRPKTDIFLRIKDHTKVFPYFPVDRQDGHPNHGFKDVKGRVDEALKIAEVLDDIPMQEAVARIADNNTAFFTMGCEKSFNKDETGYWARGYLEFAYNYAQLMADAASYFPLFFHFNESLKKQEFIDPIRFEWELEGNVFRESDFGAFSAAVWITTIVCPTEEEVRLLWAKAWKALTDHLVNWPKVAGLPTLFGSAPPEQQRNTPPG